MLSEWVGCAQVDQLLLLPVEPVRLGLVSLHVLLTLQVNSQGALTYLQPFARGNH